MNRPLTVLFVLAAVVAGSAPSAHAAAAAAPAPRRSAVAAKVSGAQLFQKLDMLDKKMDDLMKNMGAATQAAANQKPVAPAANPGEGAAAKQMAGAFYNYGVYMQQASHAHMAARVIRDLTLLGGGTVAIVGYESARDKTVPRTMNNAFKDYPAFSFGVSTALVGFIIGEVVDLVAGGAEAKAAKALMQPLEDTPASKP